MSEEQLNALLAKLKDDAGLREKLQGIDDLDNLVAIAKEVGFDLSKAEIQTAQQSFVEGFADEELSDEALEGVAGGGSLGSQLICGCRK
jgi:predicted ribosomally synthesized peptide with nif11-like leader